MDEKERMLTALFSRKDGREILDVKFFVGENRNVTGEEISAEFIKARSQIDTAAVQPVESLDRGIAKKRIQDFIA